MHWIKYSVLHYLRSQADCVTFKTHYEDGISLLWMKLSRNLHAEEEHVPCHANHLETQERMTIHIALAIAVWN